MSERPNVLVAGGGVAALETLLALHELVGHRVRLELLAPGTHFMNRPASVAEPFGLGGPAPVPFAQVAGRCRAALHSGTLARVRPDDRVAVTGDGNELPYDSIVVAVGARAADTIPGALPFGGPQDVPMLTAVLDAAERGDVRAIAFAVPPGIAWTLPLYELAIMTAVELRSRGAGDVRLTLVTSENTPLWLFGDQASAVLSTLLRERGIDLVRGRAKAIADGELVLERGERVPADRTIVVPPMQGPWIAGIPHDDHGFIPVDAHGRVGGAPGVFAAGDATSFPIKQGGLASQQADVVATTVAAELGAVAAAPPFRPVLRGLLLTGGAPLYLRAELTAKGTVRRTGHARPELRGEVSARALWWPPGKVAGRYLAPYMATARPAALGREPLVDRAITAVAEPPDDATDALELALLMAEEDARAGDLAQAVHALDAAAALSGGFLPAEAARKREAWRATLDPKTLSGGAAR
jgi:sulfide:quinone oxidoreductase